MGDIDEIKWTKAKCCDPIPGDDVMGYIRADNTIEIHRVNCSKAIQVMSKFGDRIIKAKWREQGNVAVLAGVKIVGVDKKGLINEIVSLISAELSINIRSFDMRAEDGIMEGELMLYVRGAEDLKQLF
ncbi:MAG: ACT domain-containing protein, partial [Bacteroidota bacterium]|nr:ACT domain-containing protein [Bacteroidota bacterium]